MQVWRICSRRHQRFDGEGARLYGGRWNYAGTAVVYTSASLALAALELFVHIDVDLLPNNLVAIAAEVPERLATLPSIRIPQRHRHDLGSKRFNSNLNRALCHHSRGAKLSSQSSAPRFQASSLAQIDPVSLRPPHVEVSHARGGATFSVGAVECAI